MYMQSCYFISVFPPAQAEVPLLHGEHFNPPGSACCHGSLNVSTSCQLWWESLSWNHGPPLIYRLHALHSWYSTQNIRWCANHWYVFNLATQVLIHAPGFIVITESVTFFITSSISSWSNRINPVNLSACLFIWVCAGYHDIKNLNLCTMPFSVCMFAKWLYIIGCWRCVNDVAFS